MAYARIQHAGGAVNTTLNGSITSGATSLSLLAATGWPDGSIGPFYLVIDAGLATEEKIQATTRTTTTLNTLTRGVDGTSASAHASGATVSHCFTAVEADEANVAVNKTIGQVTTKGDLLAATASQTISRLAAGANNTVLHADSAAGTGLSYSKIVEADITAATITAASLATNAVTTVKITDANVTAAKMAANSVATASIVDANVTLAKFASGLQPVQVCTSGTRPGSPTAGMIIYETDTGNTLIYHGATDTWRPPWNLAWGHVATPKNITSDQGSISAIVDVTGASFTFTAVANRLYKHTVRAMVRSDTAGAAVIITITNNSNVELDRGDLHVQGATSEDTLAWSWNETGLSAGSTIRKLRVNPGAGNCSLKGTTAATQYSIEDVGPTGLPS